jgi:hypothetical protein
MNLRRCSRYCGPSLGALALAVTLPLGALATHESVRGHPQRHAAPPAAFVFGREGGNIRPYTVTILTDGTVTASGPVRTATRRLGDPQDAIAGLMKLARAEQFWAMPAQMVGHGLPDLSGRFISIHAAGSTKTVHVRFVHVAAFDQLYAVLLAVTGAL